MLKRHEAALAYARQGVPIFPLVVGGKEPACLHSFDDASTDERQIDEWWNAADYNIGCSPGAIGCFVFDFDMKGGGLATLRMLEAVHEVSAVRVRTPSGGLHVWWRGNSYNPVRKLPGMDIRGDRGYVLLPPSAIDGVEYAWIADNGSGSADDDTIRRDPGRAGVGA